MLFTGNADIYWCYRPITDKPESCRLSASTDKYPIIGSSLVQALLYLERKIIYLSTTYGKFILLAYSVFLTSNSVAKPINCPPVMFTRCMLWILPTHHNTAKWNFALKRAVGILNLKISIYRKYQNLTENIEIYDIIGIRRAKTDYHCFVAWFFVELLLRKFWDSLCGKSHHLLSNYDSPWILMRFNSQSAHFTGCRLDSVEDRLIALFRNFFRTRWVIARIKIEHVCDRCSIYRLNRQSPDSFVYILAREDQCSKYQHAAKRCLGSFQKGKGWSRVSTLWENCKEQGR